jgi:hypothetical protein
MKMFVRTVVQSIYQLRALPSCWHEEGEDLGCWQACAAALRHAWRSAEVQRGRHLVNHSVKNTKKQCRMRTIGGHQNSRREDLVCWNIMHRGDWINEVKIMWFIRITVVWGPGTTWTKVMSNLWSNEANVVIPMVNLLNCNTQILRANCTRKSRRLPLISQGLQLLLQQHQRYLLALDW